MRLDIDYCRAQFPALARLEHQGVGFFENAGGSWPCAQVLHRLERFYQTRKVQPYWHFEASAEGGAEMDDARTRLSAMMGLAPDELAFGPSTTQNVYVVSQALRDSFRAGDALIVTNQDHEANSGAWRRLALAGFELREWRMDPATGHLDPADLAALLDDRVRLVSFPHCSNVVGEINDVPAITAMIREAGAISCVDGVSYAPHGVPDVAGLGADIYLFSAYKVYGPHQGVMAMRRAMAQALPNQGHYFNAEDLTAKFTPAGPDHAQIAAIAGIADYFEALADHHGGADLGPAAKCALSHDLMRAHESALLQPLLTYLGQKNSVRLLGPSDAARRTPTVAIDLGRAADPVAKALVAKRIWLAGDHFYSARPLEALGIDPARGVLRMSFVHYTTQGEVDQLIGALDEVL